MKQKNVHINNIIKKIACYNIQISIFKQYTADTNTETTLNYYP